MKINWPWLGGAAKDSILEALCILLMVGIVFAPLIIALSTNCIWWLILYPAVFRECLGEI